MIKTIIFDINGVVARFDFPSLCATFANRLGISPDFVLDHSQSHKEKLLIGTYSAEESFADIAKETGADVETIRSEWIRTGLEMGTLNGELLEHIDKLRKKHVISVLSNVTPVRKIFDEAMRIYEHFDHVTLSCDEHLKKPDPRFFQIALDKASSKPAEAIFVDDREKYVSAAVALGMRGVVYSNNENLVRELATLLPT